MSLALLEKEREREWASQRGELPRMGESEQESGGRRRRRGEQWGKRIWEGVIPGHLWNFVRRSSHRVRILYGGRGRFR